jgi:hypothetical protein
VQQRQRHRHRQLYQIGRASPEDQAMAVRQPLDGPSARVFVKKGEVGLEIEVADQQDPGACQGPGQYAASIEDPAHERDGTRSLCHVTDTTQVCERASY